MDMFDKVINTPLQCLIQNHLIIADSLKFTVVLMLILNKHVL